MKYVQRVNGVVTGIFNMPQMQDDGSYLTDPNSLADDDPEIIAFIAAPVPPSIAQLEADCLAALNGGASRIDFQKLIKAKVISDEAFRLGKTPATLTAQDLSAIRARIAAIYKNL